TLYESGRLEDALEAAAPLLDFPEVAGPAALLMSFVCAEAGDSVRAEQLLNGLTPSPDGIAERLLDGARLTGPPGREAEAWLEIGYLLIQSNYLRAAVRCLQRSLQNDPEQEEALASLAIAHWKLSENDESLACVDRALQLDPTQPLALYVRAAIRGDAM